MKLIVDRFVYGPPGLSVIAETDFEAAILARYWKNAVLTKGAASDPKSFDGFSYGIQFVEPKKEEPNGR